MSNKPLSFPSRSGERVDMLCTAISMIVMTVVTRGSEVTVEAQTYGDDGFRLFVTVWQGDLARLTGRGAVIATAIREYVRAFEDEHGGQYLLSFRS